MKFLQRESFLFRLNKKILKNLCGYYFHHKLVVVDQKIRIMRTENIKNMEKVVRWWNLKEKASEYRDR